MNPRVTTFPALIRWIAEKYHDGAVLPIAAKIRVSPALVHLWVTGNTRHPKIDSLERLCAAYSLDFDFVRGLLRRSPPPISGGSGGVPVACAVYLAEKIASYRTLWGWLVRPLHPQCCPA